MSINNNTDFDLDYQEDVDSYIENRSMINSSLMDRQDFSIID